MPTKPSSWILPSEAASILARDSSTKEQKAAASKALKRWRRVVLCVKLIASAFVGAWICYLVGHHLLGYERVPAVMS